MSLKAQQHVIRFAALCGRGPVLESLPHPPSFTPLLCLCHINRKSPKYRLTFPLHDGPPLLTWPHRGSTFLSLSLYLSFSLTHIQTVFLVFSHNLCLSVLQRGQNPSAAKIKTEILKKKWAEKKNYRPLVWACMMQASRESYPSEWKIYDCLPLFQNITLTFSRSKRSSPPCLFSMKSLRFLKT